MPKLFASLRDEYPGKLPNENLLNSFLIRKGFSDTGAKKALRSFLDTVNFIEQDKKLEVGNKESEEKEPVQVNEKEKASVSTRDTILGPTDDKDRNEEEESVNQLEIRWRSDSYVDIMAKKHDRSGLEMIVRWINANKQFIPNETNKE